MKHLWWLTPILLVLLVWVLVRPGIFIQQPIGAAPEGGMVIYHSRGPDMPFFASADGLCLTLQGSVSLLCRATALAARLNARQRSRIRALST